MKFTIITPTFNRHDFLDETIHSVVTQTGEFDVEYIVQDGGSGPAVLEIFDRWNGLIESGQFEPNCNTLRFQYVVEPDTGMYDAINKGFERATGDVLAWLNSDDVYFPGCFQTVQQVLDQESTIDWLIGQTSVINAEGEATYTDRRGQAISKEFVRRGYYRVDLRPFHWLPQDSMFWRKSLWDKAGPLDTSRRLVSDFELWRKFAEYAEPVKVFSAFGAYREHGNQLTGNPHAYTDELGPPPKMPLGVFAARYYAGALRKMPLLSRVLPGIRIIPRLFGLKTEHVEGHAAVWDAEAKQWKIVVLGAL